ncbi:MAG: gamma-glutamylcyclotransferase [bacterium]|jgi:gamma-glutamylcyclotransferase
MVEPPVPQSFIEGRSKDLFLFTYDVYMDIVRLHRYIPSARLPKPARLVNHKLWFPYYFNPAKSGLPSITRSEGDEVWGLLWRCNKNELPKFERKLEAPNRYHIMEVRIVDRAGDRMNATTYAITQPNVPPSKPSKAKLSEIIELGKAADLPNDYLTWLAAIETL